MSKFLDVYLHSNLVGKLEQNKHGHILFRYTPTWIENPQAIPLSHSLPLLNKTYTSKECQGFFAGVLPEEENRKLIASILGVSAQNNFSLLEQIGGECAGAVSFLPQGESVPPCSENYEFLTEKELTYIIQELPKRPLLAGEKDIRLSLAGAQNKLAVFSANEGIALPKHNSPSSHILKPANPRFETLVENEYFCMKLAAALDLPVAEVSYHSVDHTDFLLVKRFDRINTANTRVERVHQEDFCQALGCSPHNKYQNEGGPSLVDCLHLIKHISSSPAQDVLHFLDAVLFNYLIGNNDAHGKNFSFLYHVTGKTRLSPLYDLVSTMYYSELSSKMAMKIGSQYVAKQVTKQHWHHFWETSGLNVTSTQKRAIQFTKNTLETLLEWENRNSTQQSINVTSQTRCNSLLRMLI